MSRVYFSSIFLEKLKPLLTRVEYWDQGFRGRGSFGIRLSVKGRKTFILLYREAGRLKRKSLGTYPSLSLAKARKLAYEDIAKLTLGQKVNTDTGRRTFSDLANSFMLKHPKQASLKSRTVAEYQRILAADLQPRWGNLELASITRGDVNELLDEIAFERDAPVMANRTLALISVMFNFALDAEWIDANPCSRMKKRIVEKSRERYLDHDEIRALWGELANQPDRTAAVYRLILLTGQRGGEVRQMRWSQNQGDLWVIPSGVTKNKREHRVPLSEPALAILARLRAMQDGDLDCVFPLLVGGSLSWMRTATLQIQDAVGFHFTPHDLRRTCATNLSELGIDDTLIARILNHSWPDKNVTAVYNRFPKIPEMQRALERWGARLDQIVTKSPAKVVKFR